MASEQNQRKDGFWLLLVWQRYEEDKEEDEEEK